ncbi:MAG: AAA family ATPase [Methanomassiliicoccaceae archaeon]|nr:AAA family ATPase [Methanomassiliicoccaceae archaeon]
MRIMFAGTSSNVGKTLITALFCRYLRTKMIMVSPFKAFNLSSNSFVTDDGSEIGIGQALQAWASDLIPDKRMNPVLMRYENNSLRTFVNGKEVKDKERKELLDTALTSFDELSDMYDVIVSEGSGSFAEINLRENDIANINLATSRNIPVILIGDIEKGGVFAGIYGTWRLTEEKHRHLLKGFIINKYYGERKILESGIERIASLTGMRCFGVIPSMNIKLPEEDSSPERERYGDDEIDTFIKTMDTVLEGIREHVDLDGIMNVLGSSARCDP